jgi:hypothetical protein
MENKNKLYKDLENYAKTNGQGAGFRPLSKTKTRRLPLNLLLMFAVLGFLFYLWQDDSLGYDPKNPHSKKLPSFVARLTDLASRNRVLRKYVTGIDAKNRSQQAVEPDAAESATSASTSAKPEGADYMPTDEDLQMGRYVQIGGHYFKYSPDHIYFVNGIRTYFVSNRKKDIPPPPTNSQSSDPLIKVPTATINPKDN